MIHDTTPNEVFKWLPTGQEIISSMVKNIIWLIIGSALTFILNWLWGFRSNRKRWLKKIFKGANILTSHQVYVLPKSLKSSGRVEYKDNSFSGIYASTDGTAGMIISEGPERLPFAHYKDILAFANIYGLFHSLRVDDTNLRHDDSEDKSGNIFCIGGPAANLWTRYLMDKWNEYVKFVTINEKQQHIYIAATDSKYIYKSNDVDYGIILKIKNPSDEGKYCVICAGIQAEGTAGASYYFARKLKDIRKEFGSKSFCIIVEVKINLGFSSSMKIGSILLNE